MRKLLQTWLRLLEEMEKSGGLYDKTAPLNLEIDRERYEKDQNPIHLMRAFDLALEYELPIPEWVINGLDADKRFQKYRALPQQCEDMEWLNSAEVMSRLGCNDLTLAKHVSSKDLSYYVRSGKWMSEVAQAVRRMEITTYKGNRVHLIADNSRWLDLG